MKIGVFDSGKGGTTVLREIQRLLPEAEYKYIGDTENCPYGDKSDAELWRIVTGHVEKLRDFGAEIIVIACNTATTRCISRLRRVYPDLIFVGTEPAVRLAAQTEAKCILIMATMGTVRAERMRELLERNRRAEQEIILLPCQGLADAIEKGERVDETLDMVLRGYMGRESDAISGALDIASPEDDNDTSNTPDVVVLGCTHYSLIKEKIQARFPSAQIIDGNNGVARRVVELVKQKKREVVSE